MTIESQSDTTENTATSRPTESIEWLWVGVLIVSVALGLGLTWFGPN